MAITPIDLQINVGQLHEVGRNEYAKTAAAVEQRNFLHEESAQTGDLKKNRLDETAPADDSGVRDVLADDKEQTGGRKKEKDGKTSNDKGSGESSKAGDVFYDDKLGRTIDIRK